MRKTTMRLAKVKSAEHVGGLNLRKTPSPTAQIIDTLAPGDEIEVLDDGSTGGWFYARYKGQRGWVRGTYIEWLTHPPLPPDVLPVEPSPVQPSPPARPTFVEPEPEPQTKTWLLWGGGAVVLTLLGAMATCTM
jgi:hypothetical protein